MGEEIILPVLTLPPTQQYETPSLDLPTANIPSYKPLVVPPSDLIPPEGVKAETKETTEQPSPPSIKLPVINADLPLPTTEVVMAATYAAVSAVAVTTFAQPFFNFIKKQIQKRLQKKVDKWITKKKENG